MNVRVGDVDLRLFLPSGNWDYLYPPASGEVTAELTFDDQLPESFFLYYSKKPPVPVSCPVFEIGTKGEPRISNEIIEAIVSSTSKQK